MKKATLFLSFLLALGLGACSSTETSRSTGQTLDDAGLTARVKTEIAQQQSVGDAARINVDTYKGTVSLSGFVDTEAQKRAAAEAASQVSGVERVVNNLMLTGKQ